MKYGELKRFVKEFEEEFALGEVIYLKLYDLLEEVQTDPKNCDKKHVDRMVEFLAHYGMTRNVRRQDFNREKVSRTIRDLRNHFNFISGENILTVDLKDEKIRKSIRTIYFEVKELPQIGSTEYRK